MSSQRKFGYFLNWELPDEEFPAACRRLKEIGYDAAEIPVGGSTPALLKQKSRIAAENGLFLSEGVAQDDYVRPDPEERRAAIQRTLDAIRGCAEAGIPVVNLFTGPVPWGPHPLHAGKEISFSDAWSMVTGAFDVLVPEAERCGVCLAVENVWGHLCHDFFTMRYLIGQYDSDRLGVNFDPSHDVLSGNTDMRFLIGGWGKKLFHVHLKDAAGIMEPGKFIFPLPGEGFVDWNGFMAGLDEIGYTGVLSVEFEADGALAAYLDGDRLQAAELAYRGIRHIFG